MTITWCEKDYALEEFQNQLLPWVERNTLRDIYSAAETKQYVTEAVKWAFMGGSQTALDLLHFVLRARDEIHVIGMKGGFQCFGSEEGLRGNKRAVFIDIDGILFINQRVSRSEHNLRFPPWLQKGPPEWLVNTHYKEHARDSEHVATRKFEGSKIALDNRIAALHELGHAKQCIERPEWFAGKLKGSAGIGKKPGSVPNPRIRQEGKKDLPTQFAADIQKAAQERAQRAGKGSGHIQTKDELAAFAAAPPAWDPVIEMDNMSRHEWPICREMGIGFRRNYCDLDGTTSAKTAKLSVLITRKIDEIAAKKLAEKEQGDPALKAASGGAGAHHYCPKDKRTYKGNVLIRAHKNTCPACK